MHPTDFVKRYKADAYAASAAFAVINPHKRTLSPCFILAQAAHESAWGERAPGNNFFGVKDSDGINGNEQLLGTTEYAATPTARFPVILSIKKVAVKLWRYVIKDHFRVYVTPREAFIDHARFFIRNRRYHLALPLSEYPLEFTDAIAKAGYATDPNYARLLRSMCVRIAVLLTKP